VARKKSHDEKPHNLERWLLTYADLITLLLIFFVVMYAISVLDVQKFQAIASSLASVLHGRSAMLLDYPGSSLIEGYNESMRMEEIREQLEEYIEANNLGGSIHIYEQERGLVISVNDTVLFPSGKAYLTPQAQEIIRKVGEALQGIPNYIRIEGHTDNLPINNAEFPSNWELSAMRATNVLRFLLRECGLPPERLSEAGFGEYRPIATNDNEAGRARNRRVDIVILKSEYSKLEPP